MREVEASLQQFGEYILKARLVKERAAPYCVRWVRRFLARPAANEPLADQVRRFCEELETDGGCQGCWIQVISPDSSTTRTYPSRLAARSGRIWYTLRRSRSSGPSVRTHRANLVCALVRYSNMPATVAV